MSSASLVIQTSFLGDMVLTTPLLQRLAARGPVDVVATPGSAPLLTHHPAVRDVIVYDKRGVARGMRGLVRTARAIRWRANGEPRDAHVAYLAQGSVRSATLATLAGVPERVGFDKSAGRRLYTHRVPYAADHHHVERLWSLASHGDDGARPRAPLHPRLYPAREDFALATAVIASAGIAPGTPLIVFAPGSIWPTKRWPHFGALAVALAQHAQTARARIVLMGSAADSTLARAVADALATARLPLPVDATGRLPILASAALLARASVIVTNDSLPLHLASAMGTPTVALFGPTTPDMGFGPLAPHAEIAEVPSLACRPCSTHGPTRCPLEHWRCMRDLPVARIIDALQDVMRLPQPVGGLG